ncbi:uncharacterized transposon-derived protein F54H12.3 [Trichonephila inaurata madagascariensis]|uniref:Uncharacterized transposon-derived protein F54H12.3 n=1 Tax=Trichonephila inaurata madagascariensis TaxID=2747483 RepID=A0A8X7C9J0_9ARAC|nr:uncharacterized transposon-derived protein F54H12.3 [Trichonephila inaurata madagascariensis]
MKMWKFFTENTKRYIDVVDKLVYSYNNTWHRSIQMTPASVTETNQSQVWENLYGKQNNKKVNKPNYRLNDTVRISKEKLLLKKDTSRIGPEKYSPFIKLLEGIQLFIN